MWWFDLQKFSRGVTDFLVMTRYDVAAKKKKKIKAVSLI